MRFTNFTWNDVPIHAVQGINLLWAATLAGPSVNISAPAITQWKWRDSLPEIADGFDDSQWVTADHVTTSNPNQPYPAYNGKYVLYLPDYGFAVGNTILRGYFTSSGGNETGLGVSVSAGTGGAAAFWVSWWAVIHYWCLGIDQGCFVSKASYLPLYVVELGNIC